MFRSLFAAFISPIVVEFVFIKIDICYHRVSAFRRIIRSDGNYGVDNFRNIRNIRALTLRWKFVIFRIEFHWQFQFRNSNTSFSSSNHSNARPERLQKF